ncbi:hypothetical protein OKW41_006264 [Paraburkholderia sp. UCT70]|uniref:hypothetical protein n=1 Tax=Paraburkholderia sp. UCT70 TaxID=2991068 RepID=UPI003D1BA16A
MNSRELAITYVGAAVAELFGYLAIPPDECDLECTDCLSATDIEHGSWQGHRDVASSRLAAEILRHAGLDGARLDGEMLTCLFAVLARSADIAACYADVMT